MTALAHDIGFLLARASGLVVRSTNERLGRHGLRVRQYSVLTLVCEAQDGLSQRELAGVLGLDPSQVVLLLDELASAGLVQRTPSPADRRTKLVSATAAGRERQAEAAQDVDGAVYAQMADLTVEERYQLRALLTRVITGTGSETQPAQPG